MRGKVMKSQFVVAGALALALYSLPVGVAASPAEYETPESAVQAVIDALMAKDKEALLHVFGPEAEDVILTGEAPVDRETWTNFVKAYKQMHRVAVDKSGDKATLFIGRDQWPVPIPLVKHADGLWAFDVDAAREEILDRRIGRNELDVIELLRGYVLAQQAFRQTDYNDDGVREFARTSSAPPSGVTASTGPMPRACRRARSATSWPALRPTATTSTARTAIPSPTSATTIAC